ncbi:carboxypeptidase-like regulatory domain-containing protein [Deltaproteobacteria bacterium TL4]
MMVLVAILALAWGGCESLKGDDGKPGMKGAPGEIGAAGANGAAGTNGVDGAPGTNGAAGAAGAAGVNGADGKDGKDGFAGVEAICAETSTAATGFDIQGSVVDQSGNSIEGAIVSLASSGAIRTATTNALGIYFFCNLEPSRWYDGDGNGYWSGSDKIRGTYTIVVKIGTGVSAITAVIRNAVVGTVAKTLPTISSPEGSTTDFTTDIPIEAGTDNYDFIIPDYSSTLTGVIVDAETAQPIAGAVVNLETVDAAVGVTAGTNLVNEYNCVIHAPEKNVSSDKTANGDTVIMNTFSVPPITVTTDENGRFTLTGLVAADLGCDGTWDKINAISISATGYQTKTYDSATAIEPRRNYSLGMFNNGVFPGAAQAGAIFLPRVTAIQDVIMPYVTAVLTSNGTMDTASTDGFMTTTAPTSIKVRFNEALMPYIDNVFLKDVIQKADFAGGDYTTDDFDNPQEVSAKISFEAVSGVINTVVITPQVPLEAGFRYKIDLTTNTQGVLIKDKAGNSYKGWVDLDGNGAFTCPSGKDNGTAGEPVDALSFDTSLTCSGAPAVANAGILDFTIAAETPTFVAPTVVASSADTAAATLLEPTVKVHVDWTPVVGAYAYRVWGQGLEIQESSTRTIGPFVEIGETKLSYDPPSEMSWTGTNFWDTWDDNATNAGLEDNDTEGAFATYSLEDATDASGDGWTLMQMDVKVGPIDINGLEGTQSTTVRVKDNTPPRIGPANLTAATRNYPFARVTLDSDGNTVDISSVESYSDNTNSQGSDSLTAARDSFRTNDQSTKYNITIKTSEPLAKATVNVDANNDGKSDNITLVMVNNAFENTSLTSTEATLYYGADPASAAGTKVPAITALDGKNMASGLGNTSVNYGTATSFSSWPGLDLNNDSEATAKSKYQAITLGLDNVFNVRTGLGIQLTGITDLHGNTITSTHKVGYLVDGIPPLAQTVTVSTTEDYVEVTFTEPVNVTTIVGGLALAGGLTVNANHPKLVAGVIGFTQLQNNGVNTAYAYETDTKTKVRIYVNDVSAQLTSATGETLVANTTVADLAPTVSLYDGTNNIAGANTVANDASGATVLNGSDNGTYLNAYGAGLAGKIDEVGPRLTETTNAAPITITETGADFATDDEMILSPATVVVNYTEAMNNSVDLYGDDYATSICNPANYAITYNTGSSTGAATLAGTPGTTSSADGSTFKIRSVVCNSSTRATLTLARNFVGTVDYDSDGATTITATADAGQNNRIIGVNPVMDGFGGISLKDFVVTTANLQQDDTKGTTTTAMTNVTARHFIKKGDLKRIFGDTYTAANPTLTVEVYFFTTNKAVGLDSDANSFEINTTNNETTITDIGSVANPTNFTPIPSGYKIKTITVGAANDIADADSTQTPAVTGEYVKVSIALIKAGTAAEPPLTGGNATGAAITYAYTAGTEVATTDQTVAVTKGPANTIIVTGVVDALGNTIDVTGNREVYTWTYAADSGENDNNDTDLVPGFHSLPSGRY